MVLDLRLVKIGCRDDNQFFLYLYLRSIILSKCVSCLYINAAPLLLNVLKHLLIIVIKSLIFIIGIYLF